MGPLLPPSPGRRRGLGLFGEREPLWLGQGKDTVSHDAIGEVLESVIELGGDGAHAAVHHLLDQKLQLFLGHVHVEALLQVADGAGAVEAGKLRACGEEEEEEVNGRQCQEKPCLVRRRMWQVLSMAGCGAENLQQRLRNTEAQKHCFFV